MRKNGTNVSGQINRKSLALIKGQKVKTHDIFKVKKGVSFKDKAYKFGASAKVTAQKGAGKIARNYKRYVGPSAKLATRVGKVGLGIGKTALRFPGATLVATGLYAGAKRAVKKSNRPLQFSPLNQYNKKARNVL